MALKGETFYWLPSPYIRENKWKLTKTSNSCASLWFVVINFVPYITEPCFREDKINQLCSVMGVNCPYDPDRAYELTTDNVKKILAIYMRFRWEVFPYCFEVHLIITKNYSHIVQWSEQMQSSVFMAMKVRKINTNFKQSINAIFHLP